MLYILIYHGPAQNFHNQYWWVYLSYDRAMHKDFSKTKSNYVIFVDKTTPSIFSRLAHSL